MDAALERLFPLVLIAQAAWPALLAATAALVAAAFLLPGGGGAAGALRLALAGIATGTILPVLLLGALVAQETWSSRQQRAAEAAITSTLAAPAVVDGIALPAGAELRWQDPTRRALAGVTFRRPRDPAGGPDGESNATALGLRGVYFLHRQGEDHWQAGIERAQEMDGWPCAAPHVFVTAAGRLRSCRLSRPAPWRGWVLPAGTEVSRRDRPPGEFLGLVLPEAGLEVPHGIGRLPAQVWLSADGTLVTARYAREAPLRVPGAGALWGDVRFAYAPGAAGEGRDRRPAAASGADPDDPASDPWRGPRRTLPWPPAR